jgi:GLPGLI family protein
MKIILTVISFFIFNFSSAQTKTKDIQVVYNVYRAYMIPYKFQAVLYIQNNVSIWKDQWNTREIWEERPMSDKVKDMTIDKNAFKIDAAPCLKTDLNKKEILFHGAVLKNWFLVKDNFLAFNWNITQETKTIAGYKCIKATTNFRGREWTAWFTPEIAVPLGPWKLRGLPGLIIEATDNSNTYIYRAEKVGPLTDTAIFKTDFASLMPLKSKKVKTYEELISENKEAEENAQKALAQKLGISIETKEMPKSETEEPVYEWEK